MKKNIRVGVFICCCGSNISGVVDILDLVKYTKKLANVVLVDEGKWSCSTDYIRKVNHNIKEYRINRVVIAACSPRTHESLFREALKKSGLNPYFLEFVSIREQVSWVHMDFPKIATMKAKDLVKMGVEKARMLEEGFEIKIPVKHNCLILGGGIAGISAALSISRQGFKIFLIEEASSLGGILNNSSYLANEGKKIISKSLLLKVLYKLLKKNNILIFVDSRIELLSGYIGNYIVKIKNINGTEIFLDIDTVIVATGMNEIKSSKKLFCNIKKKVITYNLFEQYLIENKVKSSEALAIVNCIYSKNKKRGCCNLGCFLLLKNAIALKKMNRNNIIYVIHRDISLYGKNSYIFLESKKLGIKFIRMSHEFYPLVNIINNELFINLKNNLFLNRIIKVDRIILGTAFIGSKNTGFIKEFLKISVNSDNLFQETHVKLKPLEFSAEGIGLSGCSKYPMFFEESCNEGAGAALRISISMRNGYTKSDGIVAKLDIKKCNKCMLCMKKCPYNAIICSDYGFPKLITALCRGCGLCAADCITNSISILNYSEEHILAQISAALEYDSECKIIVFVCHWCALGGVDMAGVSRLQYSPNIRIIRLMCSARVSIEMLKFSFESGAAGVVVSGCEFPTCHYIVGNYESKKRIQRAKKILKKYGFNSERIWEIWCSAADGPKFSYNINRIAKEIKLNEKKI